MQTTLLLLAQSSSLSGDSTGWFGLGVPTWGDILVGLSLVGGAISYFVTQSLNRDQQEQEQGWKRVVFIFDQFSHFDSDADISEAVKILSNRDGSVTIEAVFTKDSDEWNEHIAKFDKMFGFLEQIAYAVKNTTLTEEDAYLFEWHFHKAVEDSAVEEYVSRFYPQAAKIGKKVSEHLKQKHEKIQGGGGKGE